MKDMGIMLLAAWLILNGLQEAVGLSFKSDDVIYGILGIVAGVLLVMKK